MVCSPKFGPAGDYAMSRRVLVGVIGGDRQGDAARTLGRAGAAAGVVLLTGGGDPTSMKLKPDEAKNAVLGGALNAEADGAGAARFIGVLPSTDASCTDVGWHRPQPCGYLLCTGLAHFERNVINGVTPDVLIVMGGSRGTLAEAAFALAAKKKLFFFTDATDREGGVVRLRHNYRKHLEGDTEDSETFFDRALAKFPDAWESRPTTQSLKRDLERSLAAAEDWSETADDLIVAAVSAAGGKTQSKETGFPGLPGDADSRRQFHRILSEISA